MSLLCLNYRRAHPEQCETVFGMRVKTNSESADLAQSDRRSKPTLRPQRPEWISWRWRSAD